MSEIDPKVELEIQKAKSDIANKLSEVSSNLKLYADSKSEKARNNALAVLGLVTFLLSIGGAIGINSLVGNRAKLAIEGKVDTVIETKLPQIVSGKLEGIVPDALDESISKFMVGEEFKSNIEASLASAVRTEFHARIPEEIVNYIEAQKVKADEGVAHIEEQRKKSEASKEQPFTDKDLQRLTDDAVTRSWAPSTLLGQIQAQASCTALARPASWVTAVPRTCDGSAPTCAQICGSLSSRTTDTQISTASSNQCTGALHIYSNPATEAADKVGLKTYKYATCDQTACGPNYCCCSSF